MPTPAAIPRSTFVPRTAQPPYSHVTNSTRAELDWLGLTALRAMVDVEPYGSSDPGGDPSDDEPPSMTWLVDESSAICPCSAARPSTWRSRSGRS